MVSEQPGDTIVKLSIPPTLEQWLETMSKEWDIDRDTLIRQLLLAYQVSTTLDEISESGFVIDEEADSNIETFNQLLISSSESLNDQFADIEHQVDQLERQYSKDLEDVRKRVVQLKRELDSKANDTHSHPEIIEEIREWSQDDVEVQTELKQLVDEINRIDEKLDAGFANFRKIVERVLEQQDQHDEQLDKFASILLRYRNDFSSVSQLIENQGIIEELGNTAVRNGIRTAACENCQTTIDVGILASPDCPECSARFERLQPKDGFFGTNRLIVEDPPALETSNKEEGFEFGRKSMIEEIGTKSKANTDQTVGESKNA